MTEVNPMVGLKWILWFTWFLLSWEVGESHGNFKKSRKVRENGEGQ